MIETIFFHVDVNSAFLSWKALSELNKDPGSVDLRTIPSAVGGDEELRHGIVLAKSLPAKKYGIVTGEPLASARRKCPSLTVVRPDFSLFVSCSKALMTLLAKYAPEVEPYSIDEAFCNMTGTSNLYGDPVEFAIKLKNEIRDTLGFTVNIGVAHNRLLAKMASDFEKPDKVHTLFENEISSKMWPLQIGDLFFVGKKTAQRLNTLGIMTIGDAAETDPNVLRSNFGRMGQMIYDYANGKDDGSLIRHDPVNKGYSNETTTGADVTDSSQAKMILLSLAETVGARIRADRAVISVVSVYFRDDSFTNASRQLTLADPTDITDNIFRTACSLFDALWKGQPMRLIGLSCSKAVEKGARQMDLFDSERNEKLEKLNSAIDSLRGKYGSSSVQRASLMKEKAISDTLSKHKHGS